MVHDGFYYGMVHLIGCIMGWFFYGLRVECDQSEGSFSTFNQTVHQNNTERNMQFTQQTIINTQLTAQINRFTCMLQEPPRYTNHTSPTHTHCTTAAPTAPPGAPPYQHQPLLHPYQHHPLYHNTTHCSTRTKTTHCTTAPPTAPPGAPPTVP